MEINVFFIIIFATIFFLFFKNIKKFRILLIAKGSLQIGILTLFMGSFLKLFITLPPNIYLKIIFCLFYIWCTIGINVNLMIPLIGLIDKNIDKNR